MGLILWCLLSRSFCIRDLIFLSIFLFSLYIRLYSCVIWTLKKLFAMCKGKKSLMLLYAANNHTPPLILRKKYFTVPYIKHISNSFKSISVKFGYPMAFTIPNTLSTFIKTGKDIIERSDHCNVVYRIDCKYCDACYVGQTKRRLISRVKEHKNDINKRSGIPSVISTHRLQNHDFDWKNVRILDNESAWYRRIISEMI